MKIIQSNLVMVSSREFAKKETLHEQIEAWVDPAVSTPGTGLVVQPDLPGAGASQALKSQTMCKDGPFCSDPKLFMIKQILEKLTGRKIEISSVDEVENPQTMTPVPAPEQALEQPTPERAGWGLRISQIHSYYESETTGFHTNGMIKTADNRTLTFDLDLKMEHEFYFDERFQLLAGDALSDPLVVNFNGNSAELSDVKFAFDINADGTSELISQLKPGSGFLVLDKNRDGSVNDGKELFGPETGNGFNELSRLDLDQNGWIDENDPGYYQLAIWSGQSMDFASLRTLKDAGIGALSVLSKETEFSLKDAANALMGNIRRSSVYINEDGSVGTVQQVDLAV